MRRRWMCVPMMLLARVLSACGGTGAGSRAEQLALDMRGAYLAMTACTASMEVTADYGSRVYDYGIDVSWEKEGDTVLTVTAPENIAGVTARLRRDAAALEYDGIRVETGALNQQGMSPVDAVPVLLDCAREGFIAECGLETEDETQLLHIICRDPEGTAGTGQECSLWFEADTFALLRGEIAQDGFTVIRCTFTKFERTGAG